MIHGTSRPRELRIPDATPGIPDVSRKWHPGWVRRGWAIGWSLALTLSSGLAGAPAAAVAEPIPAVEPGRVPPAYAAVLSSLYAALQSEEPAVLAVARQTTRGFLASLTASGEAEARATLRAVLREAPEPALRSQAAYGLGVLKDAPSLEELRAVRENESAPELRFSAAHALRAFGDPVAMAFVNPYQDVNWGGARYHDANLHTHTTLSDGRYDPHAVIDRYHDLEYAILALTDHDSMHVHAWPRSLYPWTELNTIYHQIKERKSGRSDRPYAEIVGEEWQNRDPAQLGMVSVEGSEISRTHHLSSLFNDYAGGTASEATAFQEIAQRGGLAVFNHPGRYQRSIDWYVDFFLQHEQIVGLEVYNQVDRYPVDRKRWDNILYRLMPDRSVWGLANDDTHTDAHFGRNRNVFILAELTADHVYEALKRGHFYFFVPVEQGTVPSVRLTAVTVEGEVIRLELDGDYDRIDWVTYNPFTDESQILAEGREFSLSALVVPAPFVRAVIVGPRGRTYTQPFGIRLL
jgi:hypothetical protein